jgi:hypothetical protein
MAELKKDMSGVLFKNDRRRDGQEDPHLRGELYDRRPAFLDRGVDEDRAARGASGREVHLDQVPGRPGPPRADAAATSRRLG